MSVESVVLWRKNLKKRLLKLFDSKCYYCGYCRCDTALEFHHIDPSKKDFTISTAYSNPKEWSSIVEEVSKCILVCANCHREIHQGLITVDASITYINYDFIDYRIDENTHHKCKNTLCSNIIPISKIHCSPECYAIARQEIDWPSIKEEIIYKKEVLNMSYVALGKEYKVSDVTIRKWYLKFKEYSSVAD